MRLDKHLKTVYEFRKATGLPTCSLHDCEYETHRQVTLEEIIEAADGVTDSIVTLAGIALDAEPRRSSMATSVIERIDNAMTHIGFKPDACMKIVHDANMSKLCKPDEVEKTIDYYNSIGVSCDTEVMNGELVAVYCKEDTTDKHGKFYPAKKLLKCIN